MTILSGAMVPSFSKYIRSQNIKQAREQIKSDLRTLQNNALTDSAPVGVAPTSTMYWGVLFEVDSNEYHYFFRGNDTDTCATLKDENKKFKLPENIISKGTYCIFFNSSNGNTSGDSYVAIKDSNTVPNIECIKINPVGLISTGTWSGSNCD